MKLPVKFHAVEFNRFTFLFLLILACLFSGSAFAFQGKMGLLISVPPEEKVHSDLYLLCWRADVDGPVNGDLFVLGGTVRVRGPVHGNVFLAGGSLEVNGPVDGDVNLIGISADSKSSSRAARLLAIDTDHEGETTGDLLAFGGIVSLNDKVGEDTLAGGGEVNAAGTHRKDLSIIAHEAVVSGTVDGNAKVKASALTLAPQALIRGNFDYTSPQQLEGIAPQVKGTITHRFPGPLLPPGFHFAWLYDLSHKMFSALWLTVVGLAVLTWFPRSAQSVVDTMLHLPWESFFTGLVLFIALPGIAVILIVSLLGLPLGIFLFAVFGVAVYLTRLFASLYIGERLLGALEHHMPPYWQSLPLGVFLFTVLTSIPYLGIAVSLIVIPLALGAKSLLGSRVYRRMRQRHLA